MRMSSPYHTLLIKKVSQLHRLSGGGGAASEYSVVTYAHGVSVRLFAMSRSLHSNLILFSYIMMFIQIIVKYMPSCPWCWKSMTKILCCSSFWWGWLHRICSRSSPCCWMLMVWVGRGENTLNSRGTSRISVCHTEVILIHCSLPLHEKLLLDQATQKPI